MTLHKVILTVIACSCLSPIKASQTSSPRPFAIPPSKETQDFSEVVVPITSWKITPSVKLGISGKPTPGLGATVNFGTGFCLDDACRFIVTNYHVAITARPKKIKGEKVSQQYLATGPQDEGATPNILLNGDVVPYAVNRDLAIFELRRSLAHHHGLTFSLDELEPDQQVEIYGYPVIGINPFRELTRFTATFKGETTSGLLAFDYQLSDDKPRGGVSGGIVVDKKTGKVVGILNGINKARSIATAVPVQTLVDFVSKVQPFLAQSLFPTSSGVSPVSADLYPKFAPPSDHNPKFVPVHSGGLEHRPEEPPEVRALRSKAQALANGIRNYVAVQSYEWGSGKKEEPAAFAQYEVQVIDGAQRFREYPDGKEDLKEVPYPYLNGWMTGSDEWSTLPTMVGTQFRLKVHQAPDVVANKRRMKVFQYFASVEDNLCPFAPVEDFGFFTIARAVAVACYGEVWTDQDTNIVRMSEHLELSDKLKAYRGWEECEVVVTYGGLKLTDGSPRLVPLTIFAEARYGKKHVYWCRGQFTNYQLFTSQVKIGTPIKNPPIASLKDANSPNR